MDDKTLFTSVMAEINKFHGTDVVNVNARVKDGAVTLEGNTNAPHIVDKLVAAVEALPGVKSVKNEIDSSHGGE